MDVFRHSLASLAQAEIGVGLICSKIPITDNDWRDDIVIN